MSSRTGSTGSPTYRRSRLHNLRHTAASLAYRATRDLKMVSELFGHSGIQITGDIYTSGFDEVDRDAAEAVARLVPRAAPARSSGAVCPQRAHTGRQRRRTAGPAEQNRGSQVVGRVGLEPTTEGL